MKPWPAEVRFGECVNNERPLAGSAVADLTVQLEVAMNEDTLKGQWMQLKGKAREQWGKLTDDDLTEIDGRREQLEGKIQQRYGYAKDQTKKEVDDWFNRLP